MVADCPATALALQMHCSRAADKLELRKPPGAQSKGRCTPPTPHEYSCIERRFVWVRSARPALFFLSLLAIPCTVIKPIDVEGAKSIGTQMKYDWKGCPQIAME